MSAGQGREVAALQPQALAECPRKQKCPHVEAGTEGQNFPAPEFAALQSSSFQMHTQLWSAL